MKFLKAHRKDGPFFVLEQLVIVILKPESLEQDAKVILEEIKKAGLKPLFLPGTEKIVIGAIGNERLLLEKNLGQFSCVDKVIPILTPYKLVNKQFHSKNTTVLVGKVEFGANRIPIIAGPCAVESMEQMKLTAEHCLNAGASVLRGGAYKPRTSPYSFQGLKSEGLKILSSVSKECKMPFVTEILDIAHMDLIYEHADAFQVGARNMQNFELLKELGKRDKPVILKRGMSATIEDFLLAAEYIVSEGNSQVILCERGIRTFEKAYRNTLDLNAVALLKEKTHLPVIVDPSHAAGFRDIVPALSYAAIAAGADGLMMEVHYDPAQALSDGNQSLYPGQFSKTMMTLRAVAKSLGRSIHD